MLSKIGLAFVGLGFAIMLGAIITKMAAVVFAPNDPLAVVAASGFLTVVAGGVVLAVVAAVSRD